MRVRNTQGHSKAVKEIVGSNPPLKEVPEHLYHGTLAENEDSIMSEGLTVPYLRQGGSSEDRADVYFHRKASMCTRPKDQVVFLFKSGQYHRDFPGVEFCISKRDVVTIEATVPPQYLEVLVTK